MTVLAKIVADYRARLKTGTCDGPNGEVADFRKVRTLRDAIDRAGNACDPRGKRFAHQRRIPGAVLARFARRLLVLEDRLAACRDFDELHEIVDSARCRGIGELTIYDAALRIGAALGYMPSKVYLHAGTAVGARRLGINGGVRRLERRDLPVELRTLPAHQIEDLLCIYKDRLRTQRPTRRGTRTR